jgi:hypothetical protein
MADEKAKLRNQLQEQYNEFLQRGVDTAAQHAANLEDINRLTTAQLQNLTRHNKLLLEYKRDSKELVGITKQIRDNEYELIDITAKLQRNVKGNREELEGIGETTTNLVRKQLLLLSTQKRNGKITAQQYADRVEELATLRRIAVAQETIAQQGDAFVNIYDQALNEADRMASEVESIFSRIPGGGLLFQYLGGDKLKTQLQGAVSTGFSAMATAMKSGLGPLQALRAGMQAFNATVMMNPVLLIVAAIALAVAAIKKLVDFASDFEKESRETAKNMGITVAQATQLRKEAMSTSTELGTQLARTEDIVAVQQESAQAFGTTAMMSADTARNIADIGKSFGYGAEEAAKVNTAFETMGVESDQAVQMQRELAAESLKAGVNVGTVMKDVAENAKSAARYFGGNVKALTSAAVEAAKLGVSISTMVKISDKLLDIEGSLAAQFEFQALSGQQMNLDKARQLALEGDIAGATKEVMNNVGGISEFNKMSMLERKKLAEATGMEVDELQKSLVIQEKLGDLTDEQKAAMAGLNLSAAELNSLSAEELQTKLAQQQAADKSAKAFDDLKTQLASALLPLGEALMQVFSLLSPIVKVLGITLKLAFTPLTAASKMLSGIVDLFYNVYDAIGMIFSGDIFDGIKQLGKTIITSILAPWQFVWDIISGIASTFGFDIGADLGDMASSALGLNPQPVGDLSMPSNGGPIVASPREGAIFQGTRNDEVAMGPGVIGNASSSPSAPAQTNASSDSGLAGILNRHSMLLEQIVMALKTPTPVQIGPKVIAELSSVLEVEQSYRKK